MSERATDASLAHLLGRLGIVEARVRAAVSARRAGDPNPDDPFRGLYLSEDHVERLLSSGEGAAAAEAGSELLPEIERAADKAEKRGDDVRLRRLARTFSLAPVDVELLLVALAPDVDARFERLYGYLHDDVTRRRASIGLALELAGAAPASPAARHRLMQGAPLLEGGLVIVEEPERPFLTRSLRVPDRVAMHLLGDDHLDAALADLAGECPACYGAEQDGLARAIHGGATLVYLRERAAASGRAVASAAFSLLGKRTVAIDLSRLASPEEAKAAASAAVREARLQDAGLVAGPVEALVDGGVGAIRELAEAGWPVILTGARTWDPTWSTEVPLLVELEQPSAADREGMWRVTLNGDGGSDLDPVTVTAQFRLGPEQVTRAARAARLQAALAGRPLDVDDLRAGARAQNAAGLERLARRIHPGVGWPDMVLPPETLEQLREVSSRAMHRDKVHDEWGMGGSKSRGRGITALFAGESGTGKTMAAEVLAGDLGLDLYAIDLATVVDKYVGETEKNLDKIFAEADRVHGVLFFDEADALFGKRSEVRDAHDRYANVEVAYLLQRMEAFDGIAILATNLRANIDDAFARRLDAVVDFPMPDEEHRLELWERCLGPLIPREADVDLGFCARAFELSGGNIRNIALAAAFLAADGERAVSMADLIKGTQREYRKLGRLLGESEFGPYYELIGSSRLEGRT
jgi:ATPase family associated with various cellular activities (AAA)